MVKGGFDCVLVKEKEEEVERSFGVDGSYLDSFEVKTEEVDDGIHLGKAAWVVDDRTEEKGVLAVVEDAWAVFDIGMLAFAIVDKVVAEQNVFVGMAAVEVEVEVEVDGGCAGDVAGLDLAWGLAAGVGRVGSID